MKRIRFSEENIIGILKEYDSGMSIADLSSVLFHVQLLKLYCILFPE